MVRKTQLRTDKSFFSVYQLILKGKEAVREYELPAGKVLVRPLSDLEMEECESILFEEIKDPATRKFAFESASESILEMAEGEENSPKKLPELDYNVNYPELIRASSKMMLMIAYMAMKDFTEDDFEPEDLKQLSGIKQLAQFVQEISGYAKKSLEDIEDFRQKP